MISFKKVESLSEKEKFSFKKVKIGFLTDAGGRFSIYFEA